MPSWLPVLASVAVLLSVTPWLAMGAAVNTTFYNAATDFSINNGNPNGAWTYGFSPATFTTFTAYTARNASGPNASPVWWSGWPSDAAWWTPGVWLNTGAALIGIPTGGLAMHPASTCDAAVLRWTAPVSGDILIAGAFFPGDTGTMAVSVRFGNAAVWSASDSGTFNLAFSNVSAGATVDFAVGCVTTFGFGTTGINATVRYTLVTPTVARATSDFSVNNGNPNNVWSYLWANSDWTGITPYLNRSSSSPGNANNPIWFAPFNPDNPPYVFRNLGSTFRGIPTNWLAFHPGPSNQLSIVRWTATAAGTVSVEAQFGAGDSGVMTVLVRINNVPAFSASDSGTFSTSLMVNVNDYIDFAVGSTNYAGGTTGLNATVTYTSILACPTTPPFLDLTRSSVATNLTLAVLSSNVYVDTSISFVGGANNCSFTGTPGLWQVTPASNCLDAFVISAPLNDFIASCNFLRDETATDLTVFRGTLLVSATRYAGAVRGVILNTTALTSIVVEVRMSTFLNATSGNLDVFGGAITFAFLQNQTFNALNPAATLFLVTSVQYPFQLTVPSITGTAGFTATVVPVFAESVGVVSSVCNTTGLDRFISASTCTQSWRIVVTPQQSCPLQTNLTSVWNVSFNIRCHASFSGVCNLPLVNTTATDFAIVTDNYCPRLITNTFSPTAALAPFQDAAFSTPQAAFVFGSRSFFLINVTSPVMIAAAHIERIDITAGAAPGVTTIYSKPFTNASHYFDSAVGSFPSGANAAPVSLSVVDSNTNTAFTRNISFSLTWGSNVSSATGDASVPTTLLVLLRVRYANLTTVGQSSRLFYVAYKMKSMSTTDAMSATANINVRASSIIATPDPPAVNASADASTTTSMFAVVAVVVAAAVASVVAVVLVISIRRRRQLASNNSKTSTQLQSDTTESDETEIEMSSD